MNDRQLLAACWHRQPGAWDEFLARFGPLIYYSIHRTASAWHSHFSAEEVEDLFSEVLVHLIKDDCKKLRLYRGEAGATVATWIRTITVRFVIDYLRARGRGAALVPLESEGVLEEISQAYPVPPPDAAVGAREEEEAFEEAVRSLEEEDRYFIELYYQQDLSPQEIAQLLGISAKTVYTRASRIKARIQQALKQRERKKRF